MQPLTGTPVHVEGPLWRWPDGRLELGLEADLCSDRRVDWLATARWLERDFGLVFGPGFLSPIGDSWSVHARAPGPRGPVPLQLLWSDFPDELVLRAADITANALIERIRAELPSRRADLGQLSDPGLRDFKQWFRALGDTTPGLSP